MRSWRDGESRLLYAICPYDKEGKVAAHSENASLINTHPTGADARQSLQAEKTAVPSTPSIPFVTDLSEIPVFDFTVPVLSSEVRAALGNGPALASSTDGMKQRVWEIQGVYFERSAWRRLWRELWAPGSWPTASPTPVFDHRRGSLEGLGRRPFSPNSSQDRR